MKDGKALIRKAAAMPAPKQPTGAAVRNNPKTKAPNKVLALIKKIL